MSHIGVLGLQGDFAAHVKKLAELGVSAEVIRWPRQLAELDGLIIPGGESTTLLKLIDEYGFAGPLAGMVRRGGVVYGTCAGLILLAAKVSGPVQPSLGLIDIDAERNSYGRQVESFVGEGRWAGGEPLEMVFIRAPRFTRVGSGVEVLAEYDGEPVLVSAGGVMVGSFHPELSEGSEVHQLFLEKAGLPVHQHVRR
jgi:5'-phosphate synthase pdxT subunit